MFWPYLHKSFSKDTSQIFSQSFCRISLEGFPQCLPLFLRLSLKIFYKILNLGIPNTAPPRISWGVFQVYHDVSVGPPSSSMFPCFFVHEISLQSFFFNLYWSFNRNISKSLVGFVSKCHKRFLSEFLPGFHTENFFQCWSCPGLSVFSEFNLAFLFFSSGYDSGETFGISRGVISDVFHMVLL